MHPHPSELASSASAQGVMSGEPGSAGGVNFHEGAFAGMFSGAHFYDTSLGGMAKAADYFMEAVNLRMNQRDGVIRPGRNWRSGT